MTRYEVTRYDVTRYDVTGYEVTRYEVIRFEVILYETAYTLPEMRLAGSKFGLPATGRNPAKFSCSIYGSQTVGSILWPASSLPEFSRPIGGQPPTKWQR